ncbi:MAG: AbgT family transporter [Bdellovibrionaceae bacterium]|nr:AbgT family transporter [Pseudobdellovibrionaceae bacterium]
MKNSSHSFWYRLLLRVEAVGNALPHPALLFFYLTVFVFILSGVVTWMDMHAAHPVSKEVLTPVNLFSSHGVRYLLTDMVKNFTSFAPLGTVLVAMLGFSLAEKSGLLSALLRILVLKASRRMLVPIVLMAGVLSHTGGDIGYVLLIPLAAMTFHSAGLNPLAGLAICFAGVSGGFAANLLLSTADPLLSGISQEAARILDKTYVATALSNWYFMASSSFLIVAVGSFIAYKVTIPFLGEYQGPVDKEPLQKLSTLEWRGLKAAGLVVLLVVATLVWGLAPENGFLRDPKTPDLFHSSALKGIVALIFILGAGTGLAFGFTSGSFKKVDDIVKAMQEAMATMAPYLVLVFFASQFISLFNYSNIGIILAVKGSEVLKSWELGMVPLMLGFILLTVLLDLVIGSASAKWALMAPIFVPMFMLLGISPELSQTSYRVADSVVNIISPLMSYFPMVLAFANKYEPKAKVGTIVALMLPYSMGFLIFWSLMLFVWITLGLPVGPGAPLHYHLPSDP